MRRTSNPLAAFSLSLSMTGATRAAALAVAAASALAAPGCRDPRADAAQRSLASLNGHVEQARGAVARFITGFDPLIAALAPSLATPLAAANEGNVRFELIGMKTRQVPAGSLTLFPTGFVAAVNAQGRAVARDVPEDDDHMRGTDLAALFPAVRAALSGTAGHGLGELPATADQPARVYLVSAAPVRDPAGAVVGALVAGVSFGQLSRSIDGAVRTAAGPQPVIWVGLRRAGRVMPSGSDRDVPPRWLVPAALVSAIPGNTDSRLTGTAPVTWTFVENGQRGWAGAVATLPELEGSSVLLYRSEAEQR